MSGMSEFIKRGTIYEKLDAIGGCHATDAWSQGWDKAIDEAISIVENAPAADAVDVVRCKDCKYFHNEKILYAANIIDEHADGICALRRSYTDNIEHTNVNANDFCSSGEGW